MPIKVKGVTILDGTGVSPVDRRTAVLGMNVDKLNVRAELDGAGAAADAIPEVIPIEIMAQEPKQRRGGMASMSGPLKTTAKRDAKTLAYTATVDPWKLAPFMKASDS